MAGREMMPRAAEAAGGDRAGAGLMLMSMHDEDGSHG